jgi:hypothetical protein
MSRNIIFVLPKLPVYEIDVSRFDCTLVLTDCWSLCRKPSFIFIFNLIFVINVGPRPSILRIP